MSRFSYMIRFTVVCLVALVASGFNRPVHAQPENRIHFNGQDLFLSGGNVAWVNFANDIGPGTTDLARFETIFSELHANGGNAMRLWLHTTGGATPAWNGNVVTGPGAGAIDDLRDILDLAWKHEIGLQLCLWSFDMLNIRDNPTSVTNRSYALLTDTTLIRSYIDNALVPMVDALKDHPGIIAWEIFNEPEGMSTQFGWSHTRHVPMSVIQRFINLTAGAIHRADPDAQVTNGSWAFRASSDAGSGNMNYYTDERLVTAGGDSLGTLDYYTVHYYEWAGTALSPFHHDYSYWQLDKPLVVAEFFMGTGTDDGSSTSTFGVAYQDLYETLYDRGYAGAMAWQWFNYPSSAEGVVNWPRMLETSRSLWEDHRDDVDIVSGFGITYFEAAADTIEAGSSTVLKWSITDAASAILNGEVVDISGRLTVRPSETTSYILEATGLDGETATQEIVVHVVVPVKTNRALGKPAFASSNEAGLGHDKPSYAFDGKDTTRWSSEWQTGAAHPDSQWIYVDLGDVFTIDEVALFWETAYGSRYTIDVSDDAQLWTTVFEENNGNGGTDTIQLETPVDTRYVRMHGRKRATQYGYSLWEFRVYEAIAEPTRYEMEAAAITGEVTVIRNDAQASGSSYLDMKGSGTITLDNVVVDASGIYTLTFGYNLAYDVPKSQYLDVNNIRVGEIEFTGTKGVWATRSVDVSLQEGANTISLEKFWGWMYFDYLEVRRSTGTAAEDDELPGTFALGQNYPNPFNPETVIPFTLPAIGQVRLDVYDVTGRHVATLVDGIRAAGEHTVRFGAEHLASGVYFYRLQAGAFVRTARMVLLR